MILNVDDTIAAVATAAGGALRGVIRLSGPAAIDVVSRCLEEDAVKMRLADVRTPTVVSTQFRLDAEATLPCDLFVWPTERSYTRQVVVEIHTLGSPPLLDAALRAVCAAGARLAGPGEFTLRAFLGGRLDLAQAEAVLGVIDAQDRRSLDVALAQLAGGLSQPLDKLRDRLVDLLADLEAGLDFVDEDIEFVSPAEVEARLADAAEQIAAIADQLGARARRDSLPRVVLAGPPNAGKSSLVNALCGGTAIVSHIAGTTRDALVARVEFDGVACELVDTAGLDESQAAERGTRDVERGTPVMGLGRGEFESNAQRDRLAGSQIAAAAQSQTHERLTDADVEVWCFDATEELPPATIGADPRDAHSGKTRLAVATKTDLRRCPIPERGVATPAPRDPRPAPLSTSSLTGHGLRELRTALADAVLTATHAESSVVSSTAVRCRESLRLAAEAIDQARQLASARAGDELIASELRLALAELGKIVGVVYTDDILDRLFGRFCIGK